MGWRGLYPAHKCALWCVLRNAIWKSCVFSVHRRRRLGSTWLGAGAVHCVIFSSWTFSQPFFFFSFSFLLSFAQEPIRLLSRSHTQNLFLSDLARSQSKSLFRQVGVCSQRCRISSEWLTGHIFSVYGSDCFVFFGLKKIQKIHHTWFWNSHKSSCVLSMLCTNLLISLAICSLLWSISYQEIRTMELCHLCLWCLLFELTDRWLWMQPRLQGILQEHVISISK